LGRSELFDEEARRIIFEKPVLVHVCILSQHSGLDVQSLVLLHDFLNFLLLSHDLIIKPLDLILHSEFLFVELLNLLVNPSRLHSGGVEKLGLEFLNFSLSLSFVLLLVFSVELSNSFLLVLFDFLDFSVKVIFLFEEARLVVQSLIEELAEAVEVVDSVDQE
jgi:hypothetical protein